MNPELSLVIPVLNEEDNIQPMIQRIEEALSDFEFEVVFVDDGSSDQTVAMIKEHGNFRVKAVELMKNFGQSSAMQAGIDHAVGEFIVTLDGDLQNDPGDIPMLLHLCKSEGWDLVAGERANRQDGMVIRKVPSMIANSIIRKLTEVKIRDYGCTLKIFKNQIAKDLNLYGELHRFIPVLAWLQGARIHQVPVNHHPRIHGTSKYNLSRTFKVVSDLMLMLFMKKYLIKPMHLFGKWGFILFFIGALINFYFLVLKVLGHDIWNRPLILVGLMLVLGGVQLITIGIVTELQVRTYYESQNKKIYNVRNVHVHE